MLDFLLNPLFWAAVFLVLVICDLIAGYFRKRKTKQQRKQSSILCHHCGAPMLESDVFCENCWKITPNVKKMLYEHPERKPMFYSKLNYKGHNHCPHCKSFYCEARTIDSSASLGIPVKYCSNCHQYFLDIWHFEWSTAPIAVKFEGFFAFRPWLLLGFIPVLIYCIVSKKWFVLQKIAIFSVGFVVLGLLWNKVTKRKQIRESYMRLQQNPEYPKILIDMGCWRMMDKKYHHLSKEPILSQKDKFEKLTKFIKEAFTFD